MATNRDEQPSSGPLTRLAPFPEQRQRLYLPDWTPDVAATARDSAASISDEETAAFYLSMQFLFVWPVDLLKDLYERIGVPPRRRVSPDRARAWVALHWGRPSLRHTLLFFGAGVFAHLPPSIVTAAWDLAEPRDIARAVTAAVRDYSEAPEDQALYYQWLALHHEPPQTLRDAAAILRRNPSIDRALQSSLDAIEGSIGLTPLKATIAAIHLTADDLRTKAIADAPEVRLPVVEHQLAESQAEVRVLEEQTRHLTAERDRLARELEQALGQVLDITAFYEGLLRSSQRRDGIETPEEPAPLAGLHVVVAGDPGHASGYRALAAALGANPVEAFDAIDDPAVQVAQRLIAADLPVLVTAYASHKLQKRVEAFIPRERLVMVDRAGLGAVRDALLAAARTRRPPQPRLHPPAE